MNVLITGATGFVGQHIVPKLLQQGYLVTAVVRDVANARRFAWFEQVSFAAMDVHRDSNGLAALLENVDAVIHLAWPGLPNYQEPFHFEENLPADFRFLKKLIASGVRHLLVAGTCFEYGMQGGPLDERGPTSPVTAYGLAKDTLRKFLDHLRDRSPFTFQWARLFYLYGDGQHQGSLLAQLDRAIDRGDQAFDMSGGEQLRDYLQVEDAATWMVGLLQHPECSGPINICSGTPISVRRLVEDHIARRGSTISLNLGRYAYLDYEPMAFWGKRGHLSTIL